MGTTSPVALDPSTAHLLGWLGVIEDRVRVAVATRRSADPTPDDPFRGLYLRDEHVDLILDGGSVVAAQDGGWAPPVAEIEGAASRAEAAGTRIRLRGLADAFGLGRLEIVLLLVALAPDIDSRYERLYGYLNDDVSRRRASIGLCLELAGAGSAEGRARAMLSPGSSLVRSGLVHVEEAERPFLTRSVRVPDRVAAHLLGDDRIDPALSDVVVDAPAGTVGDPDLLARALAAGARLVYLRETTGTASRLYATAGLAEAGLGAIVIDLDRAPQGDIAELAAVAGREARLRGAGLVAGPVECVVGRGPQAVRALAELECPVVLSGHRSWDSRWSRQVAVVLNAPVVSDAERGRLWQAAAESAPTDIAALAAFVLAPEQINRAVGAARLYAAVADRPVDTENLRRGARGENAAGLEQLATRIEPAVGWDDLVLPAANLAHLRELPARVRQRAKVLGEWRMRPGGNRGQGIIALFSGDSGTGKTMSAEVVAAELGLDLYAINLATVVDKYIGETEKNLERIFTEASQINGVLLFDEADALFGKRSEVRDAHDRYANIEVAYLLQRLETFDGLAILSTNLRSNVDEAFARRLDAIVEFPMPPVQARRALWARCLGPPLPLAGDVDLDFCARAFPLSGGNIRSIALSAAYAAADQCRPTEMIDLMRATYREYRKLGRLTLEAEFGTWLPRLTG